MSPLKIGHPKRKGSSSSHHFSGAMSVFGRVSFLKVPGTACPKPCGELRWTCASPPLQGAAAAGVEDFLFVWLVLFPRLFQHTFGTHPEQPLPIGYKGTFHHWLRRFFWGVLSGCVAIFLDFSDEQGCRFCPRKTSSETIRHRWYLPLDPNIGETRGLAA